MDWGFLAFLSEPWFVIPWYALGIVGAIVVGYDISAKNTPLKQAMKWSWPIIVLFFSVLGLALYYGTARAPDIGKIDDEKAKKEAHKKYEKNMFRKVNGAVIHCVAGDGLGIMTGMVIARIAGFNFWQEFWFEYAVGFAFGLFIFQWKSMTMMTDSKPKALGMAFRAEFFSMLTVMAGMGAVMAYVTPLAVTEQPKPLTYAFWGFGMLGLLVGYVLTFPMNWLMVKLGWKHGMGGMSDEHQAKGKAPKLAIATAMVVLGVGALALPAWLAEVRDGMPVEARTAEAETDGAFGVETIASRLSRSLDYAVAALEAERHSTAMHAIDSAVRSTEVGNEAAPDSAFASALHEIEGARHALHMGDELHARKRLTAAAEFLRTVEPRERHIPSDLAKFEGAIVIASNGVERGEIVDVDGDRLEVRLGGARDVWGFTDLSARESITVSAREVVFGPARTVGSSLVALPRAFDGEAIARR